ncbi:uncharacterized protein SCHCODRAFT_02591900 [Schizophyllum commune H4-8]|nr:uncharacterized protein SCHCODRAFT_02591900 [Schizophyllum commune H4-8]KAI5886583.1 hypothetical protein SCHCODRAFT_02591900 [Schizophyllum commune H4-8]
MASNGTRSKAPSSKRKGGAKGGKGARGKASRSRPAASRSKTGCYTCRIRRKKCDEDRDGDGSCSTCKRLNIQCLGFGRRRPDCLKDIVAECLQRIKDHLARSPSGRAEDMLILCSELLQTTPAPAGPSSPAGPLYTPSTASTDLHTPSPWAFTEAPLDGAGPSFTMSPFSRDMTIKAEEMGTEPASNMGATFHDYPVHGGLDSWMPKGEPTTPMLSASPADPLIDALQGLGPSMENPDLLQVSGSAPEDGMLFASQGNALSRGPSFDLSSWLNDL